MRDTTCKNCKYANECIMYEPTMRRCPVYKEREELRMNDTDMMAILDKIKDEITDRYSDCDICDYDNHIIFEYVRVGSILDILAIIDKYKTEGV